LFRRRHATTQRQRDQHRQARHARQADAPPKPSSEGNRDGGTCGYASRKRPPKRVITESR